MMRASTPVFLHLCFVLSTAIAATAGVAAAADLRIIAPAAPGSSWDQLAHALRSALASDLREGSVEVANVPGAGGTVGLAQFLAGPSDDALLVTGLTMLDSVCLHRTPMGPVGLTPIARLSEEPFVLAVPPGSPLKSLADLRASLLDDPGKVTWAGGPAGGIDHVAVILLLQALGIEVTRGSYVSFLTSAEAATAAQEGRVSAAFLALGEITAAAATGRLRVLGTSGPGRLANIDAPTLTDAGIPLQFANWRGLLARAGLGEEARNHLIRRVTGVTGSTSWRDLMARRGWTAAILAGDPFGDFLASEQSKVCQALKAAGMIKARP